MNSDLSGVNFWREAGAFVKGKHTITSNRGCVLFLHVRILVPRAYDLSGQRWDRRALVSAITRCREIHDSGWRMSNSLRYYCACSILVRGVLGMTILTTTEKFEFLSIESCPRSTKSCSGPFKSPAISGKPGALKGTNLRSYLSCRSCSSSWVFDLYLACEWIKVYLHLRYTELYIRLVSVVWECQLCTNRFASKCYKVLRFTPSKISRSNWRPSF